MPCGGTGPGRPWCKKIYDKVGIRFSHDKLHRLLDGAEFSRSLGQLRGQAQQGSRRRNTSRIFLDIKQFKRVKPKLWL